MVTREQFKSGVAMYLNDEFIAKVPGIKKWAIVLISNEMLAQIDSILDRLPENSYVTKDGMIDIDRLYRDMSRIADSTGEVTENVPLLGDVRFSKKDIDELYRLIAS